MSGALNRSFNYMHTRKLPVEILWPHKTLNIGEYYKSFKTTNTFSYGCRYGQLPHDYHLLGLDWPSSRYDEDFYILGVDWPSSRFN